MRSSGAQMRRSSAGEGNRSQRRTCRHQRRTEGCAGRLTDRDQRRRLGRQDLERPSESGEVFNRIDVALQVHEHSISDQPNLRAGATVSGPDTVACLPLLILVEDKRCDRLLHPERALSPCVNDRIVDLD